MMKPMTITRMLWVLMLVVIAPQRGVMARESRKEPNLLPVPLGVNLLGGIVSSQEALETLASSSSSGGRRPSSEVEMDYDYFAHAPAKDPFFGLDSLPASSGAAGGPSLKPGDGTRDTSAYYDYYDSTGHESSEYDAFSVFYDSMFPEIGPVIPGEGVVHAESTHPPARPTRPQEHTSTTTPTTTRYFHPTTTTRPSTSTMPSPPSPWPLAPHFRPSPSPASSSVSNSSSSSTTPDLPIDMSHLKAIFPVILRKFDLPESLTDDLFRDEAALQRTLLQIAQDESFRNAVQMITKFDIPGFDFSNLPKFFADLDPSMIMNLLPLIDHIDFSHIMDLLSGIGIDLSYLKGILNRGGAAAQYGVNPDGEDDSKLIYIPLFDAGNVNNVQIVGFAVVLFFLMATAYAYLEVDKKPVYGYPKVSSVSSDEILGYAEGDLFLPPVDAVENNQQYWNAYPHPGHNEVAEAHSWYTHPPSYPEEEAYHWRTTTRPLLKHRPQEQWMPVTVRPTVRPVYQARPRPRPKVPVRRRPVRPYAQRNAYSQVDSRRRAGGYRRRTTTERPYRPIDRHDYAYDYGYDYNYDDYYYYDDNYDYYYDNPPQRLSANRRQRPDRDNYYHYPTTPMPADKVRYTTSSKQPDPTTSTTTEATPTTTTTKPWPETRPTSKYAETIRTARPPAYKTVDDQDWLRFMKEQKPDDKA